MATRLDLIKEYNNAIFTNSIVNNKNILIFIYTPLKVGSTSLVSSLRISCGKKVFILHIHDENMLSIISGVKNINNITVNELIKYNASIGKQIFVIDVYRDPIERKISEYFELLTSYHFNTTDNNIINYKMELLIKRFNSLFPYLASSDYFFEKYNISLPDNFDFVNKYLLVENSNIKYIKLRLCDSLEWGKILTSILNMDIIIVKDYQTENKIIGNMYKIFQEQYKIPFNLLEMIQKCKYFNYYNSQDEKDKYMNKWKLKISTIYFEPYDIDKYNFYKDISNENQQYNIIQRDHYLDDGCACNSCYIKRKKIFLKIKNGEYINNIKIIHEEAVQEKKQRQIENISKLCNVINEKIRFKNRNIGMKI
jgi:ribosomal protein L14E/L6E/L27E